MLKKNSHPFSPLFINILKTRKISYFEANLKGKELEWEKGFYVPITFSKNCG